MDKKSKSDVKKSQDSTKNVEEYLQKSRDSQLQTGRSAIAEKKKKRLKKVKKG
jgi:hypothetical protein